MAEVTVSQTIDSIKTAAAEIDAEDFISYSTILDVHIFHAREAFNYEGQAAVLGALKEVLEEHEALARNIAWDLVTVLLPFVEDPFSATVASQGEAVRKIAEECLMTAAEVGNPREVFLKIVEAISGLSFSIAVHADDDDEEEEVSFGGRAEARAQRNGLLKFHQLLLLLSTVHLRLQAKFPSRFLSNSLSSLLTAFTHAAQSLPASSTATLVRSILSFVEFLPSTRRMRGDVKPPLPPRAPSTTSVQLSDSSATNADEKPNAGKDEPSSEDLLERRLLQSFLTHILEIYALRCRSDSNKEPGSTRGINPKYSPRFLALKTPSGVLTGGILDISKKDVDESDGVIGEIEKLASILNIQTKELLQLCLKEEEEVSDDEDADIPAPSSPSDIPLSRPGALLLLAHRLFDIVHSQKSDSSESASLELHVFPEHFKIMENFLSKIDSPLVTPIVDALLFLGRYALQTESLGPAISEDQVVTYIQTLSLISATFHERTLSFLAFRQLSDTLRLLSDDKLRLSLIKSNLDTCPFENLRCALIGLLKDLIYQACTENETVKSIFSDSDVLQQIQNTVFPDLHKRNLEEERKDSPENFSTYLQACNLLYLVTKNQQVAEALKISGSSIASEVSSAFVEPLKAFLERDDVKDDNDATIVGLRMFFERFQ